jgi:hypothetical protein
MAISPLPSVALFCSLGSSEVDALFADAPVLELCPGEVAAPAQLVDACLALIESGLALIRGEQPGTYREIVVCHAGPGFACRWGRARCWALVPTRATILTPALRSAVADPSAARSSSTRSPRRSGKHRTIEALAQPPLDRVREAPAAGRRPASSERPRELDLPLAELLGEMTRPARRSPRTRRAAGREASFAAGGRTGSRLTRTSSIRKLRDSRNVRSLHIAEHSAHSYGLQPNQEGPCARSQRLIAVFVARGRGNARPSSSMDRSPRSQIR